jgi:hypothetical protein
MSAPEPVIRRNLIVQRWGTPQVTIGSLNEPRERAENGVTFNEKWVYRVPGHGTEAAHDRIIYWLRYDFVASFVVEPDGRIVRADPRTLLAGLRDRLYHAPTRGDRVDV